MAKHVFFLFFDLFFIFILQFLTQLNNKYPKFQHTAPVFSWPSIFKHPCSNFLGRIERLSENCFLNALFFDIHIGTNFVISYVPCIEPTNFQVLPIGFDLHVMPY